MRSRFGLIGLGLVLGFSFLSLNAQDASDIEQNILLAEEALEANNYVKTYTLTRPLLDSASRDLPPELLKRAAVLAAVSELRVYPEDSVNLSKINYKSLIEDLGLVPAMESLIAAGDFFYDEQEHNTALPFYIKIDSLFKKHAYYNENVLNALLKRAEISRMNFTYEGVEVANELLNQALELAQKNKDEYGIHKTYVYLADVVGLMGHMDDMQMYVRRAMPFFKEKGDAKLVSRLHILQYAYYSRLKKYDSIIPVFEALELYLRPLKRPEELGKALYYHGHFLVNNLEQYSAAIPILTESKAIHDSLGRTKTEVYQRLLRDLGIAHKETGRLEEAGSYFESAYFTKTELERMANRRRSREMEAQYRNLEKQQEIALLNSQNRLITQQKANQRLIFFGGSLLLGLLSLGLFFLYRNRKKTNERLIELDALKSSFFTNLSHEIRTPLTLINVPLQKKLSNPVTKKEEREELEMMERNTNRLLRLVDQLLDLSKLEVGKYQLKLEEGELGLLIESLASSFKMAAEENDIDFKCDIDPIPRVRFDGDIIEKILTNLLSNAVKYTPRAGNMQLEVKNRANQLEIILENNTDVLDAFDIEKLFDRFYQADKLATGVGVGLSLVKELVELYKGNIKVSRKSQDSLSFKVTLPLYNAVLDAPTAIEKQKEISEIDVHLNAPNKQTVLWQSHMSEEDLPLLLVVEDHPEVQKLIFDLFQSEYRVIVSSDGKDGVEKAFQYIPDIIISDIMMPGMDGWTLCSTLKEDERTSHIPIILLTAKGGEENKHKGLLTGADAYVTKPFSIKLLETRVKKLIQTRVSLRNRYSQEVILKPKDIAITDLDEQFLNKVQTVLDDRLVESSFSVQEFSESVGLSRMQLHRKLKALTGLSASEFIRSQRLKLAASLLEKSNANVSQIGYQVGFNDPSYFSKCFKEAYGVTPTQYGHDKAS